MTRETSSKQKPKKQVALVCALLVLVLLVAFGLVTCTTSENGPLLGVRGGIFSGAQNSQNVQNAQNTQDARYQNALYIYMCGSTLETKSALATKNIDAILSSKLPENTAVVIETGGTRKWRGHEIPNDALVRYEVQNGALVEVERESDASMGDAQTLSSFLEFCNTNYSANNSTLLFWNHGAGSVKGVCLDENHDMDGLDASELAQALDETNTQLTNVCFDACLMANFEIARVFANHANTMVASQELEPAVGWNYTSLIENLGSENFAQSLLSSYKVQCEEKNKSIWTLSACDLTKFAQVESAFDIFSADVLEQYAHEDALQEVVQAACEAMSFGEQNSKSNLVDLAQFASNLGYKELSQAIESCVQTSNGADRSSAFGISIFFPLTTEADLDEYLKSETSEFYTLFLGKNFKNASAKTGIIQFANAGSVSGTTLNFSISPGFSSKVQSVIYDVYQLSNTEPATCLGFSAKVDDAGAGAYSIDFDGTWFALDGHMLSCEPLDTVGDVTIYSAEVKEEGRPGSLRFSFNAKTNTALLQGFVADDSDETLGRLEDINPGDEISILAEQFKVKGELDTEFSEVASLVISENTEISPAVLPDGRYEIYAIVTDIYGEEYTSDSFIVYLEDGVVVQANMA